MRRDWMLEIARLTAAVVLLLGIGVTVGPAIDTGSPTPTGETLLAPVNGFPANPAEDTVSRPGAEPVVPGIPNDIADLIHQGEFTAAAKKLETLRQSPGASGTPDARTIDWQIEKLRRYRKDYGKSRADLLKSLRDRMREFQEPELDAWIRQGLVDGMRIDGDSRFADATVSNLFFLSPELRKREIGKSEAELARFTYQLVKDLKAKAAEEGKTTLAPRQFHVEMTLTAKTPTERNGQVVRCWMPYPRVYPFITDLKLVATDPAPKKIAAPDAPQRTVYFERTATADPPSTFGLSYEFTAWSRVNTIDDDKVTPFTPNNPIVREWTREEPHVRFTPEMKALCKEIAGNEFNPAILARKFYLWICNNIRYSYAREYSTLDDLGLYCAARRAGDCGQEALVFITLCRIAGIPARWQSAWTCYPLWSGMHDWTEIYLEPYGWVPVDPYMGIWATRYMDPLTPEQRREVRDFYFGSMDAYRLPANAAHSAPFDPPKQGWRSDDVDNQRGEMEWADGTNLYFGDFKYSMKITAVDSLK